MITRKLREGISYTRINYPSVYTRMIQISNIFQKKENTIHIFDEHGGNFKDYMFKNEMDPIVAALKKGLDEYSVKTIDVLLTRLQNYPEQKYGVSIKHDQSNVIGGLLDEEASGNYVKVQKHLKEYARTLKYPSYHMDASVFYYDHGLKYLPDQVSSYIQDSDFLDLGAYFGDSAIVLHKYGYRKIFSVEMSEKAIQNYKVNMKRNRIDSSRYQIMKAAIAETDKNEPLYFSDNSYSVFSTKKTDEKSAKYSVKQRSVDSLAEELNIQPKFIKADIEGFGLECVKGAVKTLTENRPVLSLAIYHNPHEFFETKPYLESILENYTFLIRKMAITPFGLRCHAETFLLGYPNEISKS
jgi:FkbM family methyltransferase